MNEYERQTSDILPSIRCPIHMENLSFCPIFFRQPSCHLKLTWLSLSLSSLFYPMPNPVILKSPMLNLDQANDF